MDTTFAEEVRLRRKALGLSPAELAEQSGVVRNTIRNIERSSTQASAKSKRAIRGALRQLEAGMTPPDDRPLLREQIARDIEAMLDHYPEDVFPPDATSQDAQGARAMRHAYRTAARIARGEQ